MSILDKITEAKRQEVHLLRKMRTPSWFAEQPGYSAGRPSFYDYLAREGISLITEFKRRSPSKGLINGDADLATVVRSYRDAGARAVSVLTDRHFDGTLEDLEKAAEVIDIPLLRKDFIIDEIQIHEARAAGASAILLIGAILDSGKAEELAGVAGELDLDVLFEIHDEDELEKIPGDVRIVGINNRDLRTFRVDIRHSLRLREQLPEGVLAVAESGLGDPGVIREMFERGFEAFLIGERFMKEKDPGAEVSKLLGMLK